MLIEDNLIYRELLRELCEMEGHEVMEAGRAEDALDMLKDFGGVDVHNRERRIDMFIVDFNMDKLNGFELIRELRGMEQMRLAPILMISSTNKDMRELLKTEGVAFLPKPSANDLVLSTIRKMLEAAAKNRPVKAAVPPAARRAANGRAASPKIPIQPLRAHAAPPAPQPKTAPAPQLKTPPREPPPRRAGPEPSPILFSLPPTAEPELPPLPPLPPPPAVTPAPRMFTPPPAAAPPQTEHRVIFGPIDDGIKNQISQSAELTNYLVSRQKTSSAAGGLSPNLASSPIADLLEKIFESTIQQRASDIHIEPQAETLDVRLRVDGVLQPLVRLPLAVADGVVARIKILCSLNITEKRLPQDGQFVRQGAGGKTTKFRVSTLPSVHGEKIVLRALPSGNQLVPLNKVGFSTADLELVRKILRTPSGLIIMTGPTGSGKTTTLYSMLDHLNSGKRNIVTVEDPVEYQLAGITQVQVNTTIGYTFDRILRSFLRQDPDVMLVGEIRDLETAEIALKAAATGHLVLTTLHTTNAASAVQRLLSMGLPSYLVAAATRLVIAQRLVRTLCPKCKIPGTLTEDESCMLTPQEIKFLPRVWRPIGCPACLGIGYYGRSVIMEALPVLSPKARMAITKGASPDEIEQLAVAEGMSPMRLQALQLVAAGTISADEALSVLTV